MIRAAQIEARRFVRRMERNGRSIRHFLLRQLDGLQYDLDAEDEQQRERAGELVSQILDWVYPPLSPLDADEREQRATAVITDANVPADEKLAAVQRALRSTGRRRGRPRDDASPYAITALSLKMAHPHLTWTEVTSKVKSGKQRCRHQGSGPKRSCIACGEAMRSGTNRLKKCLLELGWAAPGNSSDST